MKKLLVLFVTLCVMLSSCTYSHKNENSKINVVCTAFPQYDFMREIGGDNVNLHLLLPPGAFRSLPHELTQQRKALQMQVKETIFSFS